MSHAVHHTSEASSTCDILSMEDARNRASIDNAKNILHHLGIRINQPYYVLCHQAGRHHDSVAGVLKDSNSQAIASFQCQYHPESGQYTSNIQPSPVYSMQPFIDFIGDETVHNAVVRLCHEFLTMRDISLLANENLLYISNTDDMGVYHKKKLSDIYSQDAILHKSMRDDESFMQPSMSVISSLDIKYVINGSIDAMMNLVFLGKVSMQDC